ncbi:MAG TPA: aminodeoxychorismate synthase component I [Cyclobacteriaceae bacterium]|nr:aminodeoxychorismate synthase component I [Cyclobacteriaceae bacterium]
MTINEFKATLNTWGQQKVPFLFWVDFELEKPVAIKLTEVDFRKVLFNINGITNTESRPAHLPLPRERVGVREKKPISLSDYKSKFSKVAYHLNYGDSYLTNLTVKTEIELSQSLRDIFCDSSAKYKLWVDDQFLVFSPETFIQIREGEIYSFPMKGTIDASIPGASEIILNSIKEKSEHVTIVDLIRNDLSMVASDVHVTRFRYLEKIMTSHKDLLQVSSEIVGTLPDDYQSKLGDILIALLPAGSVSGAPKPKTVEIIRQAEQEKRGYYTGVVGLFDGENLDSGVMIRFIEKNNKRYFYRSGGGITTQSDVEMEYQEMIDKVYVPID